MDSNILEGHKNPELEIKGMIGDRVEPKSNNIKRAISNGFDDKLKKGKQLREVQNAFLVIDLSNYDLTDENIKLVATQSWSKFKHYKNNLKELYFVHKDNAVKIENTTIGRGYSTYEEKLMQIKRDK